MNFRYLALCALSALFFLLPAVSFAANLVPNGDLETVSASSATTPQSWSADFWGAMTQKFTYPVAGNASPRAARVDITQYSSGDAKWYFAPIPVTPGTVYQISEDYQSNVASEIDVVFTVGGNDTYTYLAAPAASGDAWNTYTGKVTAPPGATSMTLYHLIEKVGYLTVDNVSISTGAATTTVPAKPVINSFTANPQTITQGQSTTLSWGVTGSSAVLSINQNVGTVTGTSKIVSPTATTTYTLTASNAGGTTTAQVSVNVIVPQVQPPATTSSSSLIQNGNFESGSANAPTAWSANYWGTLSPVFTYPVAGKGGGRAGQIQVSSYTSGAANWTFPQVAIAPNTVYQYAEDYTSSVVTNITVQFKMADGTFTYLWLGNPGASAGWSSVSQPITPPAGAVSFTVQHAMTSVGTLAIDNAALTAIPVPPPTSNLISNGNFEIANGASPVNWAQSFWGSNTRAFTYPVAGNGGGRAARVQVTSYASGDAKWSFPHVSASSHTIYRYTEDYTSSVTTNVTVEYKRADGTFMYVWLADLPASSSWTPYAADITVPTGIISFTVLHSLVSVGSLTLDNASLVPETAHAFASGLVSFTFDDGLISQYTQALPIINAAGLKGSFYIVTNEPASGDSGYMTWAQIKALSAAGHEIGAHTRTHPYLTSLSAANLQSEVQGSYNDLVAQGITPKTFVYPYGDVNTTVENMVKTTGFSAARGSYFGFNDTAVDHHKMYDIRLDSSSNLATIQQYIDQAVADKRWLVFEIHDVLANSSDPYTITPAFLQSVVSYVKQSGASVVTLAQGSSQLNP